MCTCICLLVYMYVCVYVSIYLCMNVFVCMCVCMYDMYVSVFVCSNSQFKNIIIRSTVVVRLPCNYIVQHTCGTTKLPSSLGKLLHYVLRHFDRDTSQREKNQYSFASPEGSTSLRHVTHFFFRRVFTVMSFPTPACPALPWPYGSQSSSQDFFIHLTSDPRFLILVSIPTNLFIIPLHTPPFPGTLPLVPLPSL